MAHSFSNFADAFAHLCGQNSVYRTYIEDCYAKCDDADDYANAGDFKWGIRYSVYAIKALATAIDNIIQGQYFEPENSSFYECYYWLDQEAGEAEIDMSAILNAMWDTKPYQCLLFIPMIDAMRAAVWDKTMNLETFLKGVKRFS